MRPRTSTGIGLCFVVITPRAISHVARAQSSVGSYGGDRLTPGSHMPDGIPALLITAAWFDCLFGAKNRVLMRLAGAVAPSAHDFNMHGVFLHVLADASSNLGFLMATWVIRWRC